MDEQDDANEVEELADLLTDNRLSELAELDEDDLRKVLKSIADADPNFDIELTGFMEDEIRKLMDDAANPEDEIKMIPRLECQAFETHDYLACGETKKPRPDAPDGVSAICEKRSGDHWGRMTR